MSKLSIAHNLCNFRCWRYENWFTNTARHGVKIAADPFVSKMIIGRIESTYCKYRYI